MIVDYTRKTEGSRMSGGGIVARCPVCKQLGERRPNKAKSKPWVFIHEASITPSPAHAARAKITKKCTSPSAGPTPADPMQHAQQMVLGR